MQKDLGPKLHQRALNRLIDLALTKYALIFAALVFGWAVAYYYLTPSGNGICSNDMTNNQTSFWNGLYFSIVTVSSLGYGDFHPIGLSKALVCIEVLVGIGLVGIVIAKLTSRRISYQIERLFVSDAQRRLDDFHERFSIALVELELVTKFYSEIYASTPTNSANDRASRRVLAKEIGSISISFRAALAKIHAVASAFSNYLYFEPEKDKYFSILPSDSVVKVGQVSHRVVFSYSQLINNVQSASRKEILDEASVEQTFKIREALKASTEIVANHCKQQEVLDCFSRLALACDAMVSGIYATPSEKQDALRPDQVSMSKETVQEPEIVEVEKKKAKKKKPSKSRRGRK